MDTKTSPKFPVTFALSEPLNEKRISYIAIKGSLHATDCSIFGLKEEDIKKLTRKYTPVINGFSISANVLSGINSLSCLGYRIISSTGETEITWTMQKEF